MWELDSEFVIEQLITKSENLIRRFTATNTEARHSMLRFWGRSSEFPSTLKSMSLPVSKLGEETLNEMNQFIIWDSHGGPDKVTAFWEVTPWSSVDKCRCLKETVYRKHGSSRVLDNSDNIPDYKASDYIKSCIFKSSVNFTDGRQIHKVYSQRQLAELVCF
jgi:hypothetical protein